MQFITDRLPLAVFLHATDSLRFINCLAVSNHKVVFTFDDPNQEAVKLELAFEQGKPVSAAAIFASQKYLRRLMVQELEKRAVENFGF